MKSKNTSEHSAKTENIEIVTPGQLEPAWATTKLSEPKGQSRRQRQKWQERWPQNERSNRAKRRRQHPIAVLGVELVPTVAEQKDPSGLGDCGTMIMTSIHAKSTPH